MIRINGIKEEYYSIAIDGPAGAGKSTIAKEVSRILDIEYIDTGAMYRALTFKVLNLGVDPKNSKEIVKILRDTIIDFKNKNIYLDGVNVNKEIRENNISTNVSYIAAILEVREQMVIMQQNMAKEKNVIMDGRDICTVVLPESKYKFFITASVEERAKRRYKELLDKGGLNTSLKIIEKEIIKRDEIDSNRKVSPLIRKGDTILVDNTNKTIKESVDEIISIIKGR